MKRVYKNIFAIILLATGIFLAISIKIEQNNTKAGSFELDDQSATIMAIKKNKDAVVNIVLYKEYNNIKEEIGAGTGFLISADGLILTNKHVVTVNDYRTTQYRITLNSNKKYYAQLIAIDPLYDIAILKIYDKNLPYVEFGDSSKIEVGSTVIAIGNALGRYQNSATKGIVSGLGRDFVASSNNGIKESLTNIIQTDAEINFGNSGGPLINLEGKVVGINVAVDQSGNSIGFAIPVNDVKFIIDSIRNNGVVIRPKFGVYYLMITPEIAKKEKLPRNVGALIYTNDRKSAIVSGSPADKAGILDGDIIFEVNAIKINEDNTLRDVIQKYKPGDRIGVKLQRGNKILIKEVVLGRF